MVTLVYYVRNRGNILKGIKLTLCSDEDREYLMSGGVSALRRQRLKRLIHEAMSQDARLSYKDLSLLLLASKATIKRDLKAHEIRKD